jgi:N-acetylglucosamine-6-sulfatase
VQPDSVPAPGWNQWHTVLGNTRYYKYDYFVNGSKIRHGSGAGDNVTHVINRDSAGLVDRYAPSSKPFYLQIDQRAPHVSTRQDPFGFCGRAPVPLARDEGKFRHARPPRSPSFNEKDIADKPPFLSSAPPIDAAGKNKMRRHWHCGLAALAGVDRGVGKVFDAVRRAGELSRTVFIFISDNGQFFGEHRLVSGKVLPYEEALRLPLAIRIPKAYRHGASRVKKVYKQVANIDLAPTILALAGGESCDAPGDCRTMDGRSLLPLLSRTGGWPHTRGLLTEYQSVENRRYATCEFTGIRTRNAIYVKHTRVIGQDQSSCVDTDQRERYNLRKDPFELNNLCFGGGNCPSDALGVNLSQRLADLAQCAGIAGRDPQVNGRPFCE